MINWEPWLLCFDLNLDITLKNHIFIYKYLRYINPVNTKLFFIYIFVFLYFCFAMIQ